MHRNILALVMLCIIASTVCGCFSKYGDTSIPNVQVDKYIQCDERPAQVYTFYDGEKIEFEYDRIGYIDVEGGEYANTGNVMDRLKYEAWIRCADGIICIRKQYKSRESGYMTDILDKDRRPTPYESTVLSGVAVKIHRTKAFTDKYGAETDTLFAAAVRDEFKEEAKSDSCSMASTFVAIILAATYLVIKLAK